jgi:hypothetical protein
MFEVEIPLALIDVKDGPGKVAAGPGSLINLGLGITDNDVVDDYQRSYAFIRARPGFKPPIWGFEDSWTFGIRLAPAPVHRRPPPPGQKQGAEQSFSAIRSATERSDVRVVNTELHTYQAGGGQPRDRK